eukprot:1152956-Pelagomonas_calceolata.AAC.5
MMRLPRPARRAKKLLQGLFGCLACWTVREGKGYIAVPACGGSLAEAKRACNQTSQTDYR